MKTKSENRKLKVWLVQHGEPPPILSEGSHFRTARLSKELASRGHDVTYWCSSLWHHKKILICQESKEVNVDNYKLHILHAGKYQSNHSLGRYLHHKKMAQLFSKEARTRETPDIIIAGMPIHYCAYEAVKLGNEKHIPVIVDIRDYWPDNLLILFPKRFQWLGRLLFKKDFFITKVALKNATVLVSMMRHMLEWGAKEYAERECNNDDRVFFIGGDDYDNSNCASADLLFPLLKDKTRGRFVINYVGSFSYFNHPMVIIEAAKYLHSIGQTDSLLFLLAGNGDYYKRCVHAARGLDNVVFLGWTNANGVEALNSISSVGIIPSHEKESFPNKAFSYLSGGLPILSSDQGDLNKLLEKYGAGVYFDISNPVQLASKILDLSKLDNESFKILSNNAKLLFQDHLRADKIYKQYADYVEYIESKYGNRRKT